MALVEFLPVLQLRVRTCGREPRDRRDRSNTGQREEDARAHESLRRVCPIVVVGRVGVNRHSFAAREMKNL
jgi:hypothetical protein